MTDYDDSEEYEEEDDDIVALQASISDVIDVTPAALPDPGQWIEYIKVDPRIHRQPIQRSMIKRQNEFLNLLAQGHSIRAVCKMMEKPLSIKTYEKWCQIQPDFKKTKDFIIETRDARTGLPEERRPKKFTQFRKIYFGFDSPPIHVQIAQLLEDSPPGSVSMVLIPPFFGKTTNITDWICWKLGNDPNHRILYISETSTLAEKVLGRVKRRMTEPRIAAQYIADYGPFYEVGQEKHSKPWTTSYITLAGSTHDEQDYSLEAVGWNSQIYGIRSDVIILDDYQTLRSSGPAQTEKMVDSFQQDILTRIDQNEGRVVIIGTRVADRDFYVRLIEEEVCDQVIIASAIDWQGNSLWPEKWPVESLRKQEKRVGKKVWARAYMMRPEKDGTATFDEATINDCKSSTLLIPVKVKDEAETWAGIDPAIDGWTAITSTSVTYEHMVWLWAQRWSGLGTGEAILAAIQETWDRTRFTKLMVEAVSFQKALARDERLEEMRRRCGFTIVEHQTNLNKKDPDFGVARMASSFISGEFIIPAGSAATLEVFQWLIDEHIHWRATIPTKLRIQDGVMSLWFQWLKWQEFREMRRQREKQLPQTAKLPYKPTQYKSGLTRYESALRGRR